MAPAMTAIDREKRYEVSSFKDVLGDLKKLHANGFVHRDIKPENMLEKNQVMFLTDFDTTSSVNSPLVCGLELYVNDKMWSLLSGDSAGRNEQRTADGLAYVKRYGTAMDDYAMVSSMFELSTKSSPLEAYDRDVIKQWVTDNVVPAAQPAVSRLLLKEGGAIELYSIFKGDKDLVDFTHFEPPPTVWQRFTNFFRGT